MKFCRPPTIRECSSLHDEVQMEVTRELCNSGDDIFHWLHLVKTGPMLMKIFIAWLRVVVNMSLVLREGVIVPILWGKYRDVLTYVLVPQHAFIMIRWFYVFPAPNLLTYADFFMVCSGDGRDSSRHDMSRWGGGRQRFAVREILEPLSCLGMQR